MELLGPLDTYPSSSRKILIFMVGGKLNTASISGTVADVRGLSEAVSRHFLLICHAGGGAGMHLPLSPSFPVNMRGVCARAGGVQSGTS